MDKTIKKKLEKKFRKELELAMAERNFLDVKIKALVEIVESLEKMEETKEE